MNYQKILTVTYSLDKGGVQRIAQVFAQAYKQVGLESKLIAVREGGVREQYLKEHGIQYWIGLNESVIRDISHWRPDIVHLHSHGLRPEDIEQLSPILENSVVVETNVFSEPSKFNSKIDISFQLSYWCEWRFRRFSEAQKTKTAIIPNPVDINVFGKVHPKEVTQFKETYGIDPASVVIGRIGQNIKAKWSPLLIETFNQLKRKNEFLHLILVNPPQNIIERALHSPYQKQITIIDKIIGDHNLSVAYSAIDIFALAAEQGESFGNVLVESMLCETPVIALSTPWRDNSQCEVVGHMKGGIIATTPRGFKKGLEKLIENEELRHQLGKKGCEQSAKRFNSIKVAKMALDAISGDIQALSDSELDNKIISIYKDSIDKPSILSVLILRWKIKLGIIAYINAYKSPQKMLSEHVDKIIRVSKSTQ
jgi:glycosyltransferase involved in cell wall biosynthesis